MKRNTRLALGLIAATAMGGAVAVPVLAHGNDWRGHGDHQGQGMMDGEQGHGMIGKRGMKQMMMRMHGAGMMGGMDRNAMMDGHGAMGGLFGDLDADGDGSVTPQEARDGLAARLESYDADGNGSLSLDEFETLHGAAIRERMVDRFQALDNDGDGQVTAEEITAPADRLERMRTMGAGPHGHDGMMDGTGTDPVMKDN